MTNWGKKRNAFYHHSDDGSIDGTSTRASTFVVNSGVVKMAVVNHNGVSARERGDLKEGEENPGYVGDGDEDGIDGDTGGLSRAPSICNSEVSELQSQYGSFRGGAKIINGVQVDVTSAI